MFSLVSSRPISHLIKIVLIVIRLQNYGASWFTALTFLVSFSSIFPTALLITALLSCCLLNLPLGTGLIPRYLVGLLLAYLVTNSPRILHSSEECPGPQIIQVFDLLFDRSTYWLRPLLALSSVAGWVLEKAASTLFLLPSPVRLASDRLVF